jgi:hypothetical protein
MDIEKWISAVRSNLPKEQCESLNRSTLQRAFAAGWTPDDAVKAILLDIADPWRDKKEFAAARTEVALIGTKKP